LSLYNFVALFKIPISTGSATGNTSQLHIVGSSLQVNATHGNISHPTIISFSNPQQTNILPPLFSHQAPIISTVSDPEQVNTTSHLSLPSTIAAPIDINYTSSISTCSDPQ